LQHPTKKEFRKSRGRRWLLAVLLTALVLAAVFVGLLPVIREKWPSAKKPVLEIIPPAFRTLDIRQPQELESVTVYPSGSESYTLRMQQGTLYLERGEELLDLSDLYAQELLEVFTQVVAQETVTADAKEVEEHLAEMGLAPAKARAVIRYRDGSEAVLEVGASVPNTSYAYYRWSGDPGIYMCDVGIAEAFALTEKQLLPVTQPQVYASLVTEVYVSNAGGQSRYAFAEGKGGRLQEPFAYPLSAEGEAQLLSALENFRLGTREAEITEDNRAAYGFDDPLCTLEIHQKAGFVNQIGENGALVSTEIPQNSLRFVIGRAEGDYFYTCAYEGECYLVSRFLAEALVRADRETLLSRTPAAMGDALIASVLITAPQGGLAVDVLRAERVLPNNQIELDEAGNPVYDVLVAINGQEGSQEQLDELTSRLQNLSAIGNIPEDFTVAQEKPRWSITVETTAGEIRQIDAWRMDAFSDALMVDGVLRHYVHSDAIDALVAGFL